MSERQQACDQVRAVADGLTDGEGKFTEKELIELLKVLKTSARDASACVR